MYTHLNRGYDTYRTAKEKMAALEDCLKNRLMESSIV